MWQGPILVAVVGFNNTLLSFYTILVYSICIRSFFRWCVFRRRHGTTVAHGCSPGYTIYGVVSGERSCWSYCTTAGDYGRLCTWAYPSPPHPVASDSDGEDDDGDNDNALDDDGDASSTDEMSTWHSTLYHLWQKEGVVLDMRVVTLRGRVSFWVIVLEEVLSFSFEGCSEDIMYLFFSFFLRYIVLVHEVLWPFIDLHCTYFLFYIVDVYFSFTYPFMCCFFFLFIHMLLIICMQSIISVSHKDALMSFV